MLHLSGLLVLALTVTPAPLLRQTHMSRVFMRRTAGVQLSELEPQPTRVVQDQDADLQQAQQPTEPTGSLLGAISLVAGTTVGAGILALPAKTLAAGFLPSTGALFVCWLYMAASGLLIAEVNVNTMRSLDRNAVSIKSMADETLGVAGSSLTSLT